MELSVDHLGKRFNRKWVFRNLSTQIPPGLKLAITGPNGSGKSTLLKILAGAMPQSEGRCTYMSHGKLLQEHEVPRQVTFAGPYMELIDELTLLEHLRFHARFRQFRKSVAFDAIPDILGTQYHWDMPIRTMSSGMLQRLKLLIAMGTETEVVFLDEPTTNLDAEGNAWFEEMLQTHCAESVVLIASNDPFDHRLCTERIFLPDYALS